MEEFKLHLLVRTDGGFQMNLPWDEEGFGFEHPRKIKHFTHDTETGKEISISQEGEVSGFHAGDRVVYIEGCYEYLRGINATIIGFSEDGKIWTQPDGGMSLHSTPAQFANGSLRKINN